LRNIYDVALDDELNVLVRDNENDGGAYKIRVCHSFFGADHGYPYLYYERPDEALPPLADLGLGSSAGGVCYLESQFPDEYRGNLFFCEWGRSVVRYRLERADVGFAPVREIEFAAGADQDPYGFKPTDLVVAQDGSLLVSDWADGQRPKRGRGRIYRIRYIGEGTPGGLAEPGDAARSAPGQGPPATARDSDPRARRIAADARPGDGEPVDRWLQMLDSDRHGVRAAAQARLLAIGASGIEAVRAALHEGRIGERGRLHAVWLLFLFDGRAAERDLVQLARADASPRVRAQAVRALADLYDPVLAQHRLDAMPLDDAPARRLAELAERQPPVVLFELLIAAGRMRWAGLPGWLDTHRHLFPPAVLRSNSALAHAAMQALRRSANWDAVLGLLDGPDDDPLRALALHALADQAVPQIVDGLFSRIRSADNSRRREQYADALARVHRRPGTAAARSSSRWTSCCATRTWPYGWPCCGECTRSGSRSAARRWPAGSPPTATRNAWPPFCDRWSNTRRRRCAASCRRWCAARTMRSRIGSGRWRRGIAGGGNPGMRSWSSWPARWRTASSWRTCCCGWLAEAGRAARGRRRAARPSRVPLRAPCRIARRERSFRWC
jgi:hypothetical protein